MRLVLSMRMYIRSSSASSLEDRRLAEKELTRERIGTCVNAVASVPLLPSPASCVPVEGTENGTSG